MKKQQIDLYHQRTLTNWTHLETSLVTDIGVRITRNLETRLFNSSGKRLSNKNICIDKQK